MSGRILVLFCRRVDEPEQSPVTLEVLSVAIEFV